MKPDKIGGNVAAIIPECFTISGNGMSKSP